MDNESTPVPVKMASPLRLFRFMDAKSCLYLLVGLIGAIGTGALMPVIGPLIGSAFNSLGGGGTSADIVSAINSVCLKITFVGLGLFGAAILQTTGCGIAGSRVMLRAKENCLRVALEQDCTFYDSTSASKVARLMHTECTHLGDFFIDKVPVLTSTIATFISALVLAFTAAWDVSLVALATVPVIGIAVYITTKLSIRAEKKSKDALNDASSYAKEVLGNIRTVFSFDAGKRSAENYIKRLDAPLVTGIQASQMQGLQLGLVRFCSFGAIPLILWYGGLQVNDSKLSGGDVFAVLSPLLMAVIILAQNSNRIRTVPLALMAAEDVLAFLDGAQQSTVGKDGDSCQELAVVAGDLELDTVRFAYPVSPDVEVLKGVSLKIPAGYTAALVGESGSGKSTIVSLLLRLYEPTAGRILLDGMDARTIAIKSYRQHIGLVSQEPVLFASTIAENIGFGKQGASMEEIIAAAQAAQIHEFINTLPDGYDTMVGEKGTQLSGGQKQRVAIARAFLKAPKIFVLDEATSALDTQSEKAIHAALQTLTRDCTTISIAHRLSTIQHSQIIAVMNKGEIIEQGTHATLSTTGGAYAALLSKYNNAGNEAAEDDVLEDENPSAIICQDKVSRKSLSLSLSSTKDVMTDVGGGTNRLTLNPASSFNSATSTVALSIRGLSTMLSKNLDHEKEDPEKVEKAPIPKQRLMALVQADKDILFVGILTALLGGAVLPLLTYCLMSITNVYYGEPGTIMGEVQKWALILTGIALGSGILEFAQSTLFGRVGQRLAYKVRSLLMESLVRQDVGFFDQEENNSSAIVSRLESDALHVKGQISDNFGMAAQVVGALITGFPISFYYSWQEALIMLAAVPLLLITGVLLLVCLHKIASKSQHITNAAEGLATEAIINYKVVAAFNLQDPVFDAYGRRADRIRSLAIKGAIIQGIGGGFIFFMLFGIYGLAFWFGGQLMGDNPELFNNIILGIFPVFIALVSVGQAQAAFPDVAKGTAASERVFEILDRVPPIDSSSNDGIEPASCAGTVALRDVYFYYPQRPDVKVFRKFNISIPAGTSAALVGPSGSGKSTVVGLLLRFYDPVGGVVLLDERPTQSLNIHWLRKQIGLVAQEPVLFNGTVLENIRYGRPTASVDECVDAANVANATEFIDALPSGLHTSIGDQSIQLSGGQKQRLAIARAIVTNPRILVLDEATSALDTASEVSVQKALDAAMVGRTAVVIAHRLGTIRQVNNIYVLHEGRVVEEGSHNELMSTKGGRYAAMVELQRM
ncbi:hypothetical protein Ndes2526B_g01010 [Nannochloris sp. 'desiccata']